MKKFIINLLAIMLLNGSHTIAQHHSHSAKEDTSAFNKRYVLYSDLVLDWLNERNISFEWQFHRRFAAGCSYGRTEPLDPSPNLLFLTLNRDLFIRRHDTDPGRVASGHSYKIYGKYYLNKRNRTYLRLDALFKTISYDSLEFGEMKVTNYSREGSISFHRSEQSKIWGINTVFGLQETLFRIVRFEFWGGLGLRYKDRRYTTYGTKPPYPGYAPEGSFHKTQWNPALLLGLNLGFELPVRK